jgi:eukaryotic-like serine/threonine-protein kinase
MISETKSLAEVMTPKQRRLDEIVWEFFKALDEGRTPDRDRLRAENPDLIEELNAFFANHDGVPRAIGPLMSLVPAHLPGRIGEYDILEWIGGGGMGEIYKARHRTSDMIVALKRIRDHATCSPEAIVRFLREVKTVAGLDHPNIVTLHDAGEADGQPFFTMKYVAGDSLDRPPAALKGNPRAVARVMAQLARAVEYFHQHGILHRDLKPANVLLNSKVTPFVADFGLAERVLTDGAVTSETRGIAGTVPYMAPEQTDADSRLTWAVDVYGLGTILYELLTGRRPFDAADRDELIAQVRNEPPAAPRRLQRTVPRDLESICLKCLSKAPEERYASAADLADDLERLLAGRPTKARPVSPPERLLYWAKRRPAVATLTAAVVLSLTVGLGAFVVQSRRTLIALEESQRNLYVSLLFQINTEIDKGHIDLAQDLLKKCPQRLRGWEWDYLRSWCKGDLQALTDHRTEVTCVACSPDGQFIVSGGADGAVLLWKVAHLDKGPVVVDPRDSGMDYVSAIVFSRDGRRLAIARGRGAVRVWDAATWKPLFFEAHGGNIVALSPDGKLVAAAKQGMAAHVWRVRDGELLHRFEGPSITSLAFTPDGRQLLTGDFTSLEEVCFWDLKTRQANRPLRNGFDFGVSLLAFKPGLGPMELVTTQGSIVSLWKLPEFSLWKLPEFRERQLQRGDLLKVIALAYDEHGHHLATTTMSGVLTVWDTHSQRDVFSARRGENRDLLGGVAFLPGDRDRRVVFARGEAVVLERWHAGSRNAARTVRPQRTIRAAAFNREGGCVSLSHEGILSYWDSRASRVRWAHPVQNLRPACLALSGDGRTLAIGGDDHDVHVFDAHKGEHMRTLKEGHTGPVRGVAFDESGGRLASAALDATFVVWDLSDGRKVVTGHAPNPLWSVAFDPDGDHLMVGGEWGVLQRRRLSDGSLTQNLRVHKNTVHHLTFSPDGKLLATASSDESALLCDARSLKQLAKLHGHVRTVTGVAFSPDSMRLASCAQDGTVKLWNTAYPQEVLTLSGHDKAALAVAFCRDGHLLTAAHSDGAVRRWDDTP